MAVSFHNDSQDIANMQSRLIGLAKRITWLFMDVDGVLTDGGVILIDEDMEAKRFHIQDGMGITLARAAGIKTGLITGRQSAVVERRARELKMDEVQQGEFFKENSLDRILEKYHLSLEEIAYIGDDIQDIPILRRVGLPIAVQNARPEVREICAYVSAREGGSGAVREIVEWLLDLRGQKVDAMNTVMNRLSPRLG